MSTGNGFDETRDDGSTHGSHDMETEAKRVGVADHETEQEKTSTVPFYKLFSFADSVDKTLMIVGSIGAIGNALSLPLITILFGELVDSFGQSQSTVVVSVVSKVALKLVYVALGCGVAAFLRKFA